MKNILIIFTIIFALSGCVEQKDIEFFSESGIDVGTPSFQKESGYFLPITFKTKIMHSAQWLYEVKHEVKEKEIHITALYSIPPNGKESVYKNGIELKGIKKGSYSIYYINKNKSKHHVGSINIE